MPTMTNCREDWVSVRQRMQGKGDADTAPDTVLAGSRLQVGRQRPHPGIASFMRVRSKVEIRSEETKGPVSTPYANA